MTECKHNWHFIEGTDRLRCERCKVETAHTIDWAKAAVPTWETPGYKLHDSRPNYNITFHRIENGINGREVGKLDFNGPELVFTGDADESAKVFIDWVAHTFHGRLKEERQAELNACCELLEGMHAATTGDHNYYLWAANELRRLRANK